MNVAIVFPPVFDPSMPYLAPYSLAAYLRHAVPGCRVHVYDLNIRLFNEIVSNPYRNFGHPRCSADAYRSIIDAERVIDRELSEWSSQSGVKVSRQGLVLPIDGADSDSVCKYVEGESIFGSVLAELLRTYINVADYDVIGFVVSVYEQFVPGMMLARETKAVSPSTVTVGGGNVVSRIFDGIVATGVGGYFDYIVRRDGELPMTKLLHLLQGTDNSIGTNDLLRGCNGSVVEPIDETEVLDLASLPLTEFDGFEMDSYFSPMPVLPVSMSRGCSWGRCTYCGIHSGWCAKYRARPAELVVAELEHYVSRYGVRAYRLVDEGPSAAHILRLAMAIKKAKLDIRLEAYANVNKAWVSDESAKTLYEAGFRQLFLGIESVDEELLREVNKEINDPTVYRDVLDCLHRNGLMNYGFFIVGLPGDGRDIVSETERFIVETQSLNTVAVASFIPLSNSPMYTDDDYKRRYNIEFELRGDLTTRCDMKVGGVRVTDSTNDETERMVRRIFNKRKDLWVSSNLPYEARFYMCIEYGNTFGLELAAHGGIVMNNDLLSKELVQRARGLRDSK